MGFWIFMLAAVCLIPIIMIGFGRLFMNKAPEDINFVFGYRTTRSMKNKETWSFAHKYIGRLWFYGGIIILPLSIIPMFFVLGKATDVIGAAGGIIVMLQIIPLLGTIIPTENALKKNFDEFGKQR